MNGAANVSPVVLAIVSAVVVSFAVDMLGKTGGWLLLAVVLGMLIIASK